MSLRLLAVFLISLSLLAESYGAKSSSKSSKFISILDNVGINQVFNASIMTRDHVCVGFSEIVCVREKKRERNV